MGAGDGGTNASDRKIYLSVIYLVPGICTYLNSFAALFFSVSHHIICI